MLIAQISDLHIQEGPGLDGILASDHLARAVATLNQRVPRPDLVVITGDLANHGLPTEYDRLAHILGDLRIPYRLIPGNHDDRAALRGGFKGLPYLQEGGEFIQYVDDAWPARIVALDTTVPGHHHGALCPSRLRWLDDTLARQPDRPTVVIMHHPPFVTGIRAMDRIGLTEGRDEFLRIVQSYRNIERVLCGHLHRTIFCQVGNTLACTCPATAHQVELDLTEPGRIGANFEPPGYQLHWIRPGASVTHHAVIGQYGGPYFE